MARASGGRTGVTTNSRGYTLKSAGGKAKADRGNAKRGGKAGGGKGGGG